MKVRTTNALMKYLREKHNISIEGTKDKKNLKNIGYYHGYKGYRYINNPQNRINLSSFDEIVLLVEEYKTDEFNVIYENGMTDYRNSNTSEEYKKKMKQRLSVQNNIYSSLSRSYNNENKIVSHFYSRDRHVPIWGIFEIITLGTFADLIKSLEFKVRNKIDKKMNINIAFDTNAKFPEKIMYLIKSLRNSIAHNDVVFDVRFKDGKIDTKLCKYLENEIGCTGIDFNTITDYVLVISVLLKKYGITKTEINKFINDYERIIEEFRNKISISIYNKIIYSDIQRINYRLYEIS